MTIPAKFATSITRSFGPVCRFNNYCFTAPILSNNLSLTVSYSNNTNRGFLPNTRLLSTSPLKSDPQTTNNNEDSLRFSTDDSDKDSSKPTEEQLNLLCESLSESLPKFFKYPHDFRIYNKNIVFEDNIRNVRTVGLNAYAWQLAMIRFGAHFKYAKVSLNILKLTSHIEDGTVRIRWRISTYPGNSIVFAFWQFKMWNKKASYEKFEEWIDGFSIFHVGGDGLVYKHVCDKVIPDTEEVKPKKGAKLAVKLAVLLGLIPGELY